MIPSSVRIFVCTQPQDMRRSFDMLALAAQQVLGEEPQSGAMFVFANRRSNQLKVLWWDRNGYCLLYKRLHQALFRLPIGSERLAEVPAQVAERAQHALSLIRAMYKVERTIKDAPRKMREQVRSQKSRPLVDAFFAWCGEQSARVLDGTPIAKALGYASNQERALRRFLEDGRLPLDNNISERNLRREVVGRKNWLFLGSDEGARINKIFVSLLASCQLHGIEPWAYLRDLFCLLPSWPMSRILELAPAFWQQTLQQEDTQQRLAANVFRSVTLAEQAPPD